MSPATDVAVRWGPGYETWCQRWPARGDRPGLPLLVLHGGPGSTHHYLRSLRALQRDREVIFYDQIGNGRSTRLPARRGDVDFWTTELFVEELQHVVEELGLDNSGYHLLGQSWGGMLGIEWAIESRPGLASLILANAPSSIPTWIAEANRLRELLPIDVRQSLDHHEASGSTEDPAYAAATMEFYRRHFCRLDPWPEDFQASFDLCEDDPTVYETMIGPNEFHIVGSLAGWTRDRDLGRIAVPVLVLHGEHDEATDAVVAASRAHIKRVDYVRVPGASHVPHLEQPTVTLAAFAAFLARHDPAMRRLDDAPSTPPTRTHE